MTPSNLSTQNSWPLWAPFAGIALAIAMYLVLAIFGAELSSFFSYNALSPELNEEIQTFLIIAMIFPAFVVIAALVGGKVKPSRFGLNRFTWTTALIWMVAVLALDAFLEQLILGSSSGQGLQEYEHLGQWSVLGLLVFIFGVFFAPLWEEFFFRGILFPAVANKFGVAAGIVVSSLFFAAVHIESDLWAITAIFFSGMLYAAISWRVGSIVPAILLHSFNNGLAFSGQWNLGLWSVPVALACAGLLAAFLLPLAREYGEERQLLSESLKNKIGAAL